MNHQVHVFEIDIAMKPTEPLRPLEGFAVTADTLDEARSAVTSRLTSDGRALRCISFIKGGGLAAIVYPPVVATTSDKPARHRKGRR